MKKIDWKLLLNELIVRKYSPEDIRRVVNTNKTSVYLWLTGKSIPNTKFKNKILKLAKKVDKPLKLVSAYQKKENNLKKFANSKSIGINVAHLILKEIERRKEHSSNNWYLFDINRKLIKIKYFDSNKNWKVVSIPTSIKFDESLSKIVGFWFGDGVTKYSKPYRPYLTFFSADISIIKFLCDYFKKEFCQTKDMFTIEIIYGALVNQNRKKEFNKHLKKINIKKIISRESGEWNSLGAAFHIRNAPLGLLFDYFKNNMLNIIKTKENKSAFLGGYFTAEGNVSKINRWLSFHETKEVRRRIITYFLKNLGFDAEDMGDRVNIAHRDGIRKKDFSLFKPLIMPYIFCENKIKDLKNLFDSKYVRNIDLIYLFYLYLHPYSTANKISIAFHKNKDHIVKVYRRLYQNNPQLIERKRPARNKFFELSLTEEGNNYLKNNYSKLKDILSEIKRLDKSKRRYRSTLILRDPKTSEKIDAINEILFKFKTRFNKF